MYKELSLQLFIAFLFLLNSTSSYAQVGIGTTTPRGALEINSSTNGFVPPQVALTASNVSAPVVNPQGGAIATGTMVYNTATAGVSPNNVIPGFYYWDGTKWLLLTTSKDWNLTGNAATNPLTDFIGTTDAVDFVTRTNNIERMRINSAGNIGIGTGSHTTGRLNIAGGGIRLGGGLDNLTTRPALNTINIGAYEIRGVSGDLSNPGLDDGFLRLSAGGGSNLASQSSIDLTGWAQSGIPDMRNNIVMRTQGTERVRIAENGNVGIGTSAPTARLDVAAGTTTNQTVVNATGSINDFLQFNVQNTSTGTQAQSGYSATADNGTATTGFAWMGINNSTFNFPTAYNIGGANDVTYVGSGQDMHIANANNTRSIIFSTGRATTPFFNERMRITNAGNVGIGNTAPNARLDIRTNPTSTTDPGEGIIGLGTTAVTAASAGAGAIRYNTALGQIEFSNGVTWSALAVGNTPGYALYSGNTNQTGIVTNTRLDFPTTIVSGGGTLITHPSNQTFTLAAGRVYRIDLNLGWLISTSGTFSRFALYNSTTNVQLSRTAHVEYTMSGLMGSGTPALTYFINTTSGAITIDIRCVNNGGGTLTVGDNANGASYPTVAIQTID